MSALRRMLSRSCCSTIPCCRRRWFRQVRVRTPRLPCECSRRMAISCLRRRPSGRPTKRQRLCRLRSEISGSRWRSGRQRPEHSGTCIYCSIRGDKRSTTSALELRARLRSALREINWIAVWPASERSPGAVPGRTLIPSRCATFALPGRRRARYPPRLGGDCLFASSLFCFLQVRSKGA